jgi:hypothetical protein
MEAGEEGRTDFVRMRSNGARIRPALIAAATATASDAHGYGESTSSVVAFNPDVTAASGTLKAAENNPRDHCSIVWSNKLYTNVAFDAFHTPQAPSLVHSCDITSMIESTLFRES